MISSIFTSCWPIFHHCCQNNLVCSQSDDGGFELNQSVVCCIVSIMLAVGYNANCQEWPNCPNWPHKLLSLVSDLPVYRWLHHYFAWHQPNWPNAWQLQCNWSHTTQVKYSSLILPKLVICVLPGGALPVHRCCISNAHTHKHRQIHHEAHTDTETQIKTRFRHIHTLKTQIQTEKHTCTSPWWWVTGQ